MSLIIFPGVRLLFCQFAWKIKGLVMYSNEVKHSHCYVNELCWVLKYTNLHWIVSALWMMRQFRRVLTTLCNSVIRWSMICLHSMISISRLVFCKSENVCISYGTKESTIQLKESMIWNFEDFHYMYCTLKSNLYLKKKWLNTLR